jgi:hypothetical protein
MAAFRAETRLASSGSFAVPACERKYKREQHVHCLKGFKRCGEGGQGAIRRVTAVLSGSPLLPLVGNSKPDSLTSTRPWRRSKPTQTVWVNSEEETLFLLAVLFLLWMNWNDDCDPLSCASQTASERGGWWRRRTGQLRIMHRAGSACKRSVLPTAFMVQQRENNKNQ